MTKQDDSPNDKIEVEDRRKFPWFEIDNRILTEYGAKIGPYGIAAYCSLAYHANRSHESWPSYQTIADETGMSRARAVTAIASLVEYGLVQKESRRRDDGGQSSNLFILLDTPVYHVDPPVHSVDPPRPPNRQPPVYSVDGPSLPGRHEQESVNKNHLEQESGNKESASASADGPAPAPDSPVENYDAVFGPGTLSFDPPSMPEPKRPIEEEWNKPLSEMEPHRAMYVAVLDAIGWDRKTLTERDRGQVAQACRKMREAGYEYADVGEFMRRIWFQDWRWTDKASRPTLNQLRQEIGKLRAGVPENIPRRQSQGADAVDSFFDRLERQGVEIYQ